jgi:hypothetical protein
MHGQGVVPTIDVGGSSHERGFGGTGVALIALVALVALFSGRRGGLFGGGDCDSGAASTALLETVGDIKGTQSTTLAAVAAQGLNDNFNNVNKNISDISHSIPPATAAAVRSILCPELCAINAGLVNTLKVTDYMQGNSQVLAAQAALSREQERLSCMTNSNIDSKFCHLSSSMDKQFCATNANIDDKFCQLSHDFETKTNQILLAQERGFNEIRTRTLEDRIRELEADKCKAGVEINNSNLQIQIANAIGGVITQVMAPIAATLGTLGAEVRSMKSSS